jgi:hypothetical protein
MAFTTSNGFSKYCCGHYLVVERQIMLSKRFSKPTTPRALLNALPISVTSPVGDNDLFQPEPYIPGFGIARIFSALSITGL